MQRGKYALGLDIGTNSIGWACLRLDDNGQPFGILDAGARIFPMGREDKTAASKAQSRREKRGMRRNIERKRRRSEALWRALVELGIAPQERAEQLALKDQTPLELRSRGISEQLTLPQFARAIYNLSKRRGFKSNRKDASDAETGAMKEAIGKFREELGGGTVGQKLESLRLQGLPVHAKLMQDPETKKNTYPLYFDRQMVEDEFNTLWDAQACYYPDKLSPENKQRIHDIIFFQRPLKPGIRGKDEFFPEEDRQYWAFPSSQLLRIYQQLAYVKVKDDGDFDERFLTREERDKAVELLSKPQKSWARSSVLQGTVIKKAISKTVEFVDNDSKPKFKPMSTNWQVADSVGDWWYGVDLMVQDELTEILLQSKQDEEIVGDVQEFFRRLEETGVITQDNVPKEKQIWGLIVAPLEDGVQARGRTSTYKILKELKGYSEDERRPINLWEAEKEAGLREEGDRGFYPELPYYGEVLQGYVQAVGRPTNKSGGQRQYNDPDEEKHGKIPNPTVHIVFNQLRKVVNAIIGVYGYPERIVVETARELTHAEDLKKQITKGNKENEDRNGKENEELANLGVLAPTRKDRFKYRLWKELQRGGEAVCVFSGKTIPQSKLFDNDIEIEHIIPRSKTLTDSMAYLTLSYGAANRDKGARTPWEAYHDDPERYEKIRERAYRYLPRYKARLFEKSAAEITLDEFLDRQLSDTQYIAKGALQYLECLSPVDGMTGEIDTTKPITVVPVKGGMTAELRHRWGLNNILSEIAVNFKPQQTVGSGQKNRLDHRHHAIDAIVIASIDYSRLQKMSRDIWTRLDSLGRQVRMSEQEYPTPWKVKEMFIAEVREFLRGVSASHKPDRGLAGQLLEETAYGVDLDREGRIIRDFKGNGVFYLHKDLEELRYGDLGDPELPGQGGVKVPLHVYCEMKDAFERAAEEHDCVADKLSDKDQREAMIKLGEKLYHNQREIMVKLGKNPDDAERPFKKVKIAFQKNSSFKAVKHSNYHKAFKTGNNYCVEVYEDDNGKIKADVITYFDANSEAYRIFMRGYQQRNDDRAPVLRRYKTRTFSGEKLLLRLIKGDTLEIDMPLEKIVTPDVAKVSKRARAKVIKFSSSQNGRIDMSLALINSAVAAPAKNDGLRLTSLAKLKDLNSQALKDDVLGASPARNGGSFSKTVDDPGPKVPEQI